MKVLIVDDNHYMRSVFREFLRALGLRPDSIRDCNDGTEAFDLLHSFAADLAIIDYLMAPMDGLEFTRRVRMDPKSPNPYLPIILCTGYTEVDRVEKARDAGVTEVLAKPITATTLYNRIRSIIENPRPFAKLDNYFGPDRRRRFDEEFEPKRAEDSASSPPSEESPAPSEESSPPSDESPAPPAEA